MKSGWDADAYAEQMKRSTSPVSAFFLIDSLERDVPIEGPSSWEISRAGQRIVDAAIASAHGRTAVSL